MKKLLLVLAIGAFVACNDNATESEATTDSSATSTVDTNTMVTPAPDSTVVAPDTTSLKTDSVKPK